MTKQAVNFIEWLLCALVALRAAILRRRRVPASLAAELNRCRSCGCVETHSCVHVELCHRVEPDLCSVCADTNEGIVVREGL